MSDNPQLLERCREYLQGRRATYSQRVVRFSIVADVLTNDLVLGQDNILYDLGAGHCQFDRYLRVDRNWGGIYVPVDGAIDGTDLQVWEPKVQPDFFVLMEVLEHLERPWELLDRLRPRKGIVLTTPNPEVVDVLACDADHRSSLGREELQDAHFEVEQWSCFGRAGDTLVAWKGAGR